jgi:hypothetical protein
MVARIAAYLLVLISLARGVFQQTKALMKSVLCSTDLCAGRRRAAREHPAWSKHWLFYTI